jgi:putative transposase
MHSVTIKPGLRFKIEDRIYEVLKRLPNACVQVRDEDFFDTKMFTQEELISLLNKGLLKFEVKGKNIKITEGSKLNTTFDFEDIEDLKHKEQAKFRFEVIKPLLAVPYAHRTYDDIKNRVEQINSWADDPGLATKHIGCNYYKKVSRASIYRWLSNYAESGGDIRSLLPSYHKCGGKDKYRVDQKVMDFINESIKEFHLTQQRTTIRETYFNVVNKISEYNSLSRTKIQIPAFSSFARYVAKIPEYELVANRIGKRTAEQHFSFIGHGVIVNHPLERVEIDATPVDLILLDSEGNVIGRPNLVMAIDKFSRYPLGFNLAFGGVGWPEVMGCIRHIMYDKSYVKEKYPCINNSWRAFGTPKTIVIDNGLGFKNKAMEDACYQLGFVLEFCPPRVPEWKGSIERFFGTTNTSLLHNLPGTTRSNSQQLGDNEAPSKYACLTFSIFLGLLHKWMIDIYCQDINKGAGGIPSKIWDEGINDYPISWPNSTSELAILLGRLEYRKIKNTGIELNGLYYNSYDLNKLFIKFSLDNKCKDQKFKVKYDPNNLGEIYIYDHIIENEWIKVPAVCQEYAQNLTEWEHKEARAYARNKLGKVDIEALANAKAFIRKMVENNIGYQKSQIAKARKIDSSTEIFGQKSDELHKTSTALSISSNIALDELINNKANVSDLGISPFSTETIIPPVQIKECKKDTEKVIEMKNLKKDSKLSNKGKNPKNSLSAADNKLYEGNELKPEDFIGFGVIKGSKGD